MSIPHAESDFPFHVTSEATQRIETLLEELSQDPSQPLPPYLRVAVRGGGCSGFKYEFTWEDDAAEDDEILNIIAHKVSILIDAMSASYLIGATLDYKNDTQGERFMILNPKAKGRCGCGSSFAAMDDEINSGKTDA